MLKELTYEAHMATAVVIQNMLSYDEWLDAVGFYTYVVEKDNIEFAIKWAIDDELYRCTKRIATAANNRK